MSGYKHALVTVQPSEIERMHFAEQYLRAPQEEPVQFAENVRQESMVQVWNGFSELERRQQEYHKAIDRLGKMVRGWEGRLNRRLFEQEEQVAGVMQACAGRLSAHLDQILAERDQRYGEFFAEEQAVRQAQVSSLATWLNDLQGVISDQSNTLAGLSGQVDYLDGEVYSVREDLNEVARYQVSREQALAEMGIEWVEAAFAIASFIQQNYAYDFFMPGYLEQYWREAELANANLTQGAYEAGLSLGQQACLHISELRLEIEQLESEWNVWRLAALEGARHLQENLLANEVIPAMDLEGKALPFQINVNQWTVGDLDRLRARVDALVETLLSSEIELNTMDLRDLAENQIPNLGAKLERLIMDARLAVLSSQVRINIADMVVEALEEQGYGLQEAGYSEGDMRSGYSARVQSLDGSEVVIVVDPSGKSPAGSELRIQSLDAEQRSEHELRQRADEIGRSLKQKGLKIGNFEEIRTGHGNPAGGSAIRPNPGPGGRSLKKDQPLKSRETKQGSPDRYSNTNP